jgi:recombination protein RecA
MAKKEKEVIDSVLDNAIKELEKSHGKNIITTLNDNIISDVKRFSTGITSLDEALAGGIPDGRIIELIGENASGKTTVTLAIIAEVQKSGEKCLFLDSEHAFDKMWAEKNGVDINNLLFAQPETAEDTLDIVEKMAHTGKIKLIVVDSVASLVSKSELEGDIGQSHMGLTARLMGQALRKIVGICAKTGTTIIFLNQYRASLAMFGPSKVTTGGNALAYFSSVRIELKRKEMIKKGDEALATIIQAKISKSKTSVPYKTCNIEIRFDEGLSKISDIIMLAIENKIIIKGGAWFNYCEQKWQGEESLKAELKENTKLFTELKEKVLKNIKDKENASAM